MPQGDGISSQSSPSLARFSILAGYICHLKPGATVLDTGCGQGVLLRRLPSYCYSRYVGIDVSGRAISMAQEQADDRNTFLVADCEEYSPAEQFDVIVFNEVLCCLCDPLRTMERYVHSLNPEGLLLVSMCTAARGSATILWRLRRAYATVDEVRITHSGRKVSWVCMALRPGAQGRMFDASARLHSDRFGGSADLQSTEFSPAHHRIRILSDVHPLGVDNRRRRLGSRDQAIS